MRGRSYSSGVVFSLQGGTDENTKNSPTAKEVNAARIKSTNSLSFITCKLGFD
jgi:hypothetical protein